MRQQTRWIGALLGALTVLLMLVPALSAMDAIDGKWHFVLDTEGGPREAPAEFKLAGSDVSGTWGAQPTKGTFAEGKLDLEFEFDSEEVGKGTMKIVGKLDGEALVGDWKFQEYTGTFKATRPTE